MVEAMCSKFSHILYTPILYLRIYILRIKAYASTSIDKYVLSYSNYYTKSNKQLLYCLSSSVLKSLTKGESTIDWGNEFQSLITLLL